MSIYLTGLALTAIALIVATGLAEQCDEEIDVPKGWPLWTAVAAVLWPLFWTTLFMMSLHKGNGNDDQNPNH